MQQRRVRLGDILDDYCPRERRITNHAVVAMLEDSVKQTRCTTCDADHEYKEGKLPAPRRRKTAAADGVLVTARPQPVRATAGEPAPELEPADDPVETAAADEHEEAVALSAASASVSASAEEPADADLDAEVDADLEVEPAESNERDEWPVHRPLIRATLPRPEGQTPERKAPDFTFRPAGGRFETNRNGQRNGGGHRPMRQAQGQPSGQGRTGGPRGASGW